MNTTLTDLHLYFYNNKVDSIALLDHLQRVAGYTGEEMADLLGIGSRAIHAARSRGGLSEDTRRLVLSLLILHYVALDETAAMRLTLFLSGAAADSKSLSSVGATANADFNPAETAVASDAEIVGSMKLFLEKWDTHG